MIQYIEVALLLALIMVVSMLPMNALSVFGTETATVTRVLGITPNNNFDTPNANGVYSQVRQIEVTIHYSRLQSENVADIRVVLQSHGNVNFIMTDNGLLGGTRVTTTGASVTAHHFGDSIVDAAHNMQIAAATGGPTAANTANNINDYRWTRFEYSFTGGGTFPGLQGITPAERYLTFSVPVTVWGNNAQISVWIMRQGVAGEELILGQTSIVNELRENGEIAISAGTPVRFTHDLHLPTITIAERYMRVFAQADGITTPFIAVQLIAPRGYEWAEGPVAGVGDPFNIRALNGSFPLAGLTPTSRIATVIDYREVGNGRNAMTFFVPNNRVGGGLAVDSIVVENAWLRPEDYDGIRQGNVNIEVRVGGSTAAGFNNATIHTPTGWNQTFTPAVTGLTNTSLHVGIASGQDLYFRTVGDVPELRSGLDYLRHTSTSREEVTTATVQLSELVRGSWGSSAFSATEFYFGEGVQILGAQVRVSRGGTAYDDRAAYQIIAPIELGDLILTQSEVRGRNHDTLTAAGAGAVGSAERARYEGGRIRIAPETLSINLPLDPRPNRDRLYHMEVQFILSIEAGFAARHGNEIEVFMRGNAVNNSDAARSAVVAYVYDPITVELDGNPVNMQLGGLANTMEHIQIPNIVIRETDGGMLRRGDILDIHAAAIPVAVLGNLTLTGTQVVVDEASGLMLNVTSQTGAGGGVRLTVTRESREDTPAVITLSNNHYLGLVMPGVQYVVAVQNQGATTGLAGTGGDTPTHLASQGVAENTFLNLPQNRVGLFSNIAYYVQIIDFDATEGSIGVGPGVGSGRPSTGQLILREGARAWSTSDNAYVENALMLWSNPADGNVVSMLNPRIFADFIGGDIEWVEATQTVTFSGPDSNGSPVTVVLQVGSNTATINGVTHDIASFSGSGPANSVSTIISADRTFVPLRFLANAFLLPISFDHGTVVLG